MKYCIRCGSQLNEEDNFCPVCGLRQRYTPGTAGAARRPAASNGRRPTPLLIWSLALFFCINPVGTPLGAAAAILTVIANSGGPSADRCRRAARILCVIATAADILTAVGLATAMLLRFIGRPPVPGADF